MPSVKTNLRSPMFIGRCDKQSHVFGPDDPVDHSTTHAGFVLILNVTSFNREQPTYSPAASCIVVAARQGHLSDSATQRQPPHPARFRPAQPSASRNYGSPSGPKPHFRWPSQIYTEALPFMDCRQALTSLSGFQNTNSLSPGVELQLNP